MLDFRVFGRKLFLMNSSPQNLVRMEQIRFEIGIWEKRFHRSIAVSFQHIFFKASKLLNLVEKNRYEQHTKIRFCPHNY